MFLKVALVILGLRFVASSALDYRDQAELLLNQLDSVIRNAESTSLEETALIRQRIVSYGQEVTQKTQEEIEGIAHKFWEQMSQLRILGDALGTTCCMESRDIEFKIVFDIMLQGIATCSYQTRLQAINTIESNRDLINSAKKRVDLYRETLDECPRDNDQTCVVVLIGELEESMDSIPTAIMDELLRIMVMARDWEAAIDLCAEQAVRNVYASESLVILGIENCFIERWCTAV